MKKLYIIILILMILCLHIPSSLGEKLNNNTYDNSITIDSHLENIVFKLKINTLLKLGHYRSISACIVKNNSLVWSGAYGFSDKLFLQRPNKDTIYMAGSISKVVTATAIMQLWENESYDFNLDDNVSKWLTFDLKNPNHPKTNITFRMLLAHQSSLLDHNVSTPELFSNQDYSYVEKLLVPGNERYNPDYWADYQPGSKGNYSNLGFIILGYIIENMTKLSFEEYCYENILKPLDMKNSSFNISKINKFKLAPPYVWQGVFLRGQKFDFKFIDPCGGLYTSVEDLSHLLIAHLNGGLYKNIQILKKSTLNIMHKIQYPNSKLESGYYYGFGWAIWPDENDEPILMGHKGDLPGYHSRMYTRVSDNTTLIYIFNNDRYPRILLPKLSSRMLGYWYYQIEELLFQKADEI